MLSRRKTMVDTLRQLRKRRWQDVVQEEAGVDVEEARGEGTGCRHAGCGTWRRGPRRPRR